MKSLCPDYIQDKYCVGSSGCSQNTDFCFEINASFLLLCDSGNINSDNLNKDLLDNIVSDSLINLTKLGRHDKTWLM